MDNLATKQPVAADELDQILNLVHKYTGITMNSSKKILLQGRLRPRMRLLGLGSYSDYLQYLTSHNEEVQSFINMVTTNETNFFRTPKLWEYFQKDFLPSWAKQNPGKTLRIWSAASSSGEEVFTIAICCQEFQIKSPNFKYQVVGTDISTDVLTKAERGEYKGRNIEAFKQSHQSYYEKYFQVVGDFSRVSSSLRQNVRFATHNLYNNWPQPHFFEVVFLRNVLIYFEKVDQEKVLLNISKAMVGSGTLIIGESESLSSIKTPFKFIAPLIYEKSEKV